MCWLIGYRPLITESPVKETLSFVRIENHSYGQSVLGGVMGDFLGATICVLEVGIYLALAADASRFDASAFLRLAVVVSLPQIYGRLRNNSEKKAC